MQIKFKNIFIQGFRSIDNAQLDLTNQGICIVRGVNNYELNASSNGSGKSSIFEAIIYALFEETSFGDKDVANRILNRGFEVQLEFNVDAVNYKVVRKQEKNKSIVELYKDGENISARNKTDTNKLILNVIGVTKDIFLDSVILSQTSNTNLAVLSPTARKERLEFLTSTDLVINNFKDKIKQKQTMYESNCVLAQMNIATLQGEANSKNKQIDELKVKIQEIDRKIEQIKQAGLDTVEDIDNKIKNCNNIIDSLTLDNKQLDEQINLLVSEITQYNDKIQEYNQIIENFNKDIMSKQNTYKDIQLNVDKNKQQIIFANTNIANLIRQIDEIKLSDTCPTCGRKYDNINEEHIKNTIDLKNKDIQVQENNKEQYNLNITNLEKDIEGLEKEIVKLQDSKEQTSEKICKELQPKIDKLNNRKQEYEQDKSNNYIKIENLHKDVDNLNLKKQELTKLIDNNKQEYENMINELQIDILNINNKINEQKDEFNVNNNYIDVTKHILQLITKEFRTYLLQNSIKYLNSLLTKYSSKLFSNADDVIRIKSDDNKLDIVLGDATYESLSGGEKTRVDIALLLAQKSLADNIGNISYNLIVLDEMLKYCDSVTELSIIDLLVSELDVVESIYMISHKEIPVGYDKQVIVTKNEHGLSYVKVI